MNNAIGPIGFAEHAAANPNAVAVIDVDDTVVTRGELIRRINQLSNALLACDLKLDDRVALLTENSVRYLEWAFACMQSGLHLVPLNFHSTASELAYVVENSSAKVVVTSTSLAPLCQEALDLASYRGVRVADPEVPGFTSRADFIAGHPQTPPPVRTYANIMQYTSGTTGRPKGVLFRATPGVTPEDAFAATMQSDAKRGMSTGGVSLVCGPMYHGAPGFHGVKSLNWGHKVILLESWDSEGTLRAIHEYGVTHVQLAPIHFHRLLRLPREVRDRYDVSSVRAVIHAGSGCPVPEKRAMMEWFGPVLYEYYASSEGWGTVISPQQWLEHPGSVGHIKSEGGLIEIMIVGEDGKVLPRGEVGVIHVRAEGQPISEYLGDPQKTAESYYGDGFRSYGDLGYLTPEGWLYIVDRRSDMILSGAVNIYPAEVEAALLAHPSVEDVGVIGVPDEEWGQSVLAFVVPADGVAAGSLEADLRAHCQPLIARYKIPKYFVFRTELPYSPAGKLLRRKLRDRYWADVTSS
ncbi:AMP-binding protein [Arthrobacter sp. W4I7]|uniref:AMP-binding protein n=1 Tax=Arthrobacter sp. W4I7 TaxID=3042296 RepID=UPI002783251F|nr:AMP-binding protein [Arthrobacter sp. W4I7]MDQ0691453.1 long-chain acyl-CoA synthetase [Arthrobacter sp. W4I7]